MAKIKLTKRGIDSLKGTGKRQEVSIESYPGLMARVSPSGDYISFKYEYRLRSGKRESMTLGRYGYPWTADLLTDEIARLRAIIATGGSPKAEAATEAVEQDATSDEAGPTLREFVDGNYRSWCEAHQKAASSTIDRLLGSPYAALLGKPLANITHFDIEAWRTRRLKGGASKETANRDIAALRTVFAKALEFRLIADTPCRLVKMLKVSKRGGVVRYLDDAEEARLRAALDHVNDQAPYVKPLVLTALNTGMRRGELFELTWDCVDLKGRNITVLDSTTKTAETRRIPINDELLALITKWKKSRSPHCELVFHNKGTKLGTVKRTWATLLCRASIENFRFHDLRHTFASKLVMAAVPLKTVGDFLGHASPEMTRRYAHLSEDHRREAIEKLAFVG